MGGATGSDIGDGGLIMSVATPAWEGATTTLFVRVSTMKRRRSAGRLKPDLRSGIKKKNSSRRPAGTISGVPSHAPTLSPSHLPSVKKTETERGIALGGGGMSRAASPLQLHGGLVGLETPLQPFPRAPWQQRKRC